MHSSISASSLSIAPGARWNIIRTDGEPKVQPPLDWMLMAGRDICALALRCRRLMALMSL